VADSLKRRLKFEMTTFLDGQVHECLCKFKFKNKVNKGS